MTKEEVSIIGRPVKDMYGTIIGNVLGTLTHIDGQIQTVGIDCGSEGLKQIPYEQLVLQGDVVICIPGWRIDAQKILKQKRLTLSRLNALMGIMSENDATQSDADVIHDQCKTKLMELDEAESKVRDELSARLEELDSQERIIKVMMFDAKVQFKSEEISDSTFETIQKHCNNLLERLSHERVEVGNVQRRLEELSLESIELTQLKKRWYKNLLFPILIHQAILQQHKNMFYQNHHQKIQNQPHKPMLDSKTTKKNHQNLMNLIGCPEWNKITNLIF